MSRKAPETHSLRPAEAGSGVSWFRQFRSIIVGLLLTPVSVYYLLYMEQGRKGGGPYPSTISLFANCILFLALFIAICKRRHEIVLLSTSAHNHRPVLEQYSKAFLDQMVSVTTAATVISYALYVTLGMKDPTKSTYMLWTLPFVLYGVFRYLYLVYKRDEGGSPEILLLQDPSLLINVILWLLTITFIFYR